MDQWWNDIGRGKQKNSEKNLAPVPLCPPQIPRGSARARTRASAVRGQLEPWHGQKPANKKKKLHGFPQKLTVILYYHFHRGIT
jgi:hypothetical protein